MFSKLRAKAQDDPSTHIKLFSDTATQLLGATDPNLIRQIVGDCVLHLAAAKFVTVSRYDPSTKSVGVSYFAGFERIRRIAEKRDWIDYTRSQVPLSVMTDLELQDFQSGKLKLLAGGVHRLSGMQIPKVMAKTIEAVLGISGIYTMGFSWNGKLFGGVSVIMGGGREPSNIGEIEATINLGAVALQRTVIETERAMLEDQLLQAQKLEAVGRLAGGVAHDFNNLLTVITGYSNLALTDLSDSEGVSEALVEIASAASKATSLTQQLLAFSRRQVIQPTILDAGKVVEELRLMLTRLVGEHIDLQFPESPAGLCISTDRSQLEQVIINLIANARDAMPGGGAVVISLDRIEIHSGMEAAEQLPEGTYIRLAVVDSGNGIEPDIIEHIFEPFFTTKLTGEGTGLGLATAYGIVRQSGGTILPVCTEGTGTTMAIYLPAAECRENQPEGVSEPQAEENKGFETILLVEDESAVNRYMVSLLERRGYEVLSTEKPSNAVDMCRARQGDIDLLITDIVMPEMNGRELSEKIAEIQPDMKVLFVSGYTEDTVVQHGVYAGSMDFLQKPFAAGALLSRVRSILDDRESKTPVIGS